MNRPGVNPGKMSTLVVLMCSLVVAGASLAAPTTAGDAERVVTGWLKADRTPLNTTLGRQVSEVETFADDHGEPLYHIVYLRPRGFVVVAADDRVEPIVGFADDGSYDPSPGNPLGALVTRDVPGRVRAARADPRLQSRAEESIAADHRRKWRRLMRRAEAPQERGARSYATIDDVRVDVLVESRWGQTTCCTTNGLACYNYYTPPTSTPDGDPNNYPCGCVATAMAQVMRYHQHPTLGIGSVSMNISTQGVPLLAWTRGGDGLGGPYNWASMTLVPDFATTLVQRQAIGALCYDAGVLARMDYGPPPPLGLGSAAWLMDARHALAGDPAWPTDFGYSNAICVTAGGMHLGAGLSAMINPNLDYGHPVILGLFPGNTDGHAIVCDGYGYNQATLYHHFNMGWEGVQDAWYNITADMPPGYTVVDGCIYNIFVTGTWEIISGRVADGWGNPVAGAAVTALGTGGITYNTVANSNGVYAFAHVLPVSTYTVSATKAGYTFVNRVVSTGLSANGAATSGNVWGADLTPFGPDALFVDAAAIGNSNGLNWTDAYRNLQDALAVAASGDVILVAEGTYRPDQGGGETPGDRHATFQLQDGVALYGGFPQGGCNSWNDRGPAIHESILSGDIGVLGDVSDNSYHVVTGTGTDATAILDGFTVTGGNATYINDDFGGGMYNTAGGSPTVSNCIFRDNHATQHGGGMFNSLNCSPTVSNCIFDGNSAAEAGDGDYGGGMFNTTNARPILTDCVFVDNSADEGGGMFNYPGALPTLINCMFSGNSAVYSGGGMYNWDSTPALTNCAFVGNSATGSGGGMNNNGSAAVLTNCVFTGNSADTAGGGMGNRQGSSATLTNCTFSGNTTGGNGGGFHNHASTPNLANCILWGNTDSGPTDESSQIDIQSGTPVVNYSCVQGWTGTLGGTGNIGTDPALMDPDGADNTFGTEDDNPRLTVASPCLDAGDNTAVPVDADDLDGDGNTTEPVPHDRDAGPRFVDDAAADTGNGTAPIVDMGACELLAVADNDLDNGETLTLNPGGGSGTLTVDAIVEITNNSGPNNASISVSEINADLHPGSGGGYGALGKTLVVDTSLSDGQFLMTVSIPFSGADLAANADPLAIDLTFFNPASGRLQLAVTDNTVNSPGHAGPVGDRFVDQGTTPAALSGELGDYGVFWNAAGQVGFVWANVDHTTDFAAGDSLLIPGDFDADGDVDLGDYSLLAPCLTGPGGGVAPGCEAGDFDRDWDVDLADFAGFQAVLTGGPGYAPFYATDDVMIDAWVPTANYNHLAETRARNGYQSSFETNTLVKFDLSAIPPGSSIATATLHLYYFGYLDNNPADRDLMCRRVIGAWSEATVTFATRPAYDLLAGSPSTVPASTGQWMTWDVTADVQAFIDGQQPNDGWIIIDETAWPGGNIPWPRFRSKEFGQYAPYVTVE